MHFYSWASPSARTVENNPTSDFCSSLPLAACGPVCVCGHPNHREHCDCHHSAAVHVCLHRSSALQGEQCLRWAGGTFCSSTSWPGSPGHHPGDGVCRCWGQHRLCSPCSVRGPACSRPGSERRAGSTQGTVRSCTCKGANCLTSLHASVSSF